MNIIYISLSSSPGMQRYAINICNEAVKGDEVTLLCSQNHGKNDLDDRVNFMNVVSTKTPRLEPATFNILELIRIANDVKKLKPDIIHFLSDHPWNPLLTFLLKKIKTIHSIHDPIPHPGEFVTIFKKFNNYMIIKSLKQKIILHGKRYYDDLLKLYETNPEDIHIVQLATEKRNYSKVNISEEKSVLFFGRIRPYKGLDLFFKSMEKVFEKDNEIKAIVAGEGNLNPYNDLIKSKDRYEIYNYSIPEEDIEHYFKRARIVVMPYSSATQSGIISLAYNFGRPVIVTNVGSLPEVVDNDATGYVVEKDENQISKAILKAINDDKKIEEMSTKAKEKLNKELSIEGMVEEFRNIYNDL